MKNSKKFMSVVVGVAMVSQLLTITNIVTFAETNDTVITSVKKSTPNLNLVREKSETYPNCITLKGHGCQEVHPKDKNGERNPKGEEQDHVFTLNFDFENNIMSIINAEYGICGYGFHPSFPGEYITVKLRNEDGYVMQEATITGCNPSDFSEFKNKFNNFEFKYGWILDVTHREGGHRFRTGIMGNNGKITEKKEYPKGTCTFRLTQYGLEEIQNDYTIYK